MKIKKLIVFCVAIILIVPLVVSLIVKTPSFIGFINNNELGVWIGFYGSIIGGLLTLIGVVWTLNYNDRVRKIEQEQYFKKMNIEFKKRDDELKRSLSAQYKPILTIRFDSDDLIDDIKYGMSKQKDVFYEANIIFSPDNIHVSNDGKRLVIGLELVNIGRGEANKIQLQSTIISSTGEHWETNSREYSELCSHNGIKLLYFKYLDNNEWKIYECCLPKPLFIMFEIIYFDLNGIEYKAISKVEIGKFIHNKDDSGNRINHVIKDNPYDSKIQEIREIMEDKNFNRF